MEVDVSDLAVGGVLLQDDSNSKSHPIAYFSSTLQAAQRKCSAYSKEAYALCPMTAFKGLPNWDLFRGTIRSQSIGQTSKE